MFGFAFSELAFSEPLTVTPAESTLFQQLITAPVAERIFLVEIYPYEFS